MSISFLSAADWKWVTVLVNFIMITIIYIINIEGQLLIAAWDQYREKLDIENTIVIKI
jgi:hypothetical protein